MTDQATLPGQTTAPNWLRIKSNIQKMLDRGAPEADVDAYIAEEGLTVDQVKAAPKLSELQGPASQWAQRGRYYADKIATGASSVLGFMGDIPAIASEASPWVADKLSTLLRGHPVTEEERKAAANRPWSNMADTLSLQAPTTSDIRALIPLPHAEAPTQADKYIGTGLEFATAAGLGGGAGTLRGTLNAAKIGGAAGLSSEAAGQMTAETPYEPYARVMAALFGGGTIAARDAWRSANQGVIARTLQGITPDQYTAADRLIQEAARRGTNLTGAEALAHVTGNKAILGLQRAAEESARGGGIMADFMNQRPTGNAAAVNQELGQIGPAVADPSTLGLNLQQAGRNAIAATPQGRAAAVADQTLGQGMMPEQAGQVIRGDLQTRYDAVTANRSTATSPMFDAARNSQAQVNIDPVIARVAEFAQRAKGDLQAKAQQALATLKVGNTLAGVPDTSVSGLMESRKALGSMIDQATRAGDGTAASMLMDIRSELDNALATVPEVSQANEAYRQISRDFVDPYTKAPTVAKALDMDQFGGRYTLPTEKIPGMFQSGGPTAVDDLIRAGGHPSRQAFEQALISDLRQSATNPAGRIDAGKLQGFLDRNASILDRFPQLRQRFGNFLSAQRALDDLGGTPLGQVAATDNAAKQAALLLGKDPRFIGPDEVGQVVRQLSAQDPAATSAFIRQNLDDVFAKASANTLGGANQMGGANFARAIVGNTKAAQNLEAAITALPGGDTTWAGLRRLLDVLEAQGTRLPGNSATASKIELGNALGSGKLNAAVNPTGFLKRWYEDFRRGQNTRQLAELFTDPDSVRKLRELAFLRPSDAKAALIAAELLGNDAQASEQSPLFRRPALPNVTPISGLLSNSGQDQQGLLSGGKMPAGLLTAP